MSRRQRRRSHRAGAAADRLSPQQLDPQFVHRHHALLPRRPRLGRPLRGRRLHRPGRPQPEQGLPGGRDPEAGAVPGRVPGRQGNPHSKRHLQGHRRAQPKGRQHDGHGPGRRGDRPVDDGQIPPQRQQRRVAQRVHLRLVDRHDHEQPLCRRHGDLSGDVGDASGRHAAAAPSSDRSTRSTRMPPPKSRFPRPSSRSPACFASGTTSARIRTTTSTSAT